MTNKTMELQERYGHLLDKYLDADLLDWETKQQREKEAKERYGNLLDHAKPDNTILETMARLEEGQIQNREQKAGEEELAQVRRQERIEAARQREQQRIEANSRFVESVLAKKDAELKAELDRRKQEQRKAEEQQKIHDRIDYLMKISPESANAYIQALKKGNVI